MWRLVPALVAEMGSAYPELIRAEAIIKETLRLEETRFRQTLERGLKLLDEETGAARQRPGALRRGRLQALRHLRLPRRPHPGHPARPGPQARQRRLRQRPWRASAPRRARPGPAPARRRRSRSGSICARRSAPRISWAMPPRSPKARSWGWSRTASRSTMPRPGMRSPSSPTRLPSTGNPAGRWATAASSSAPMGSRSPSTIPRRSWATCSCITAGSGRAGSRWAMRWRCGSTASAGRGCAPITPPPICCMRRCAGGSAPM